MTHKGAAGVEESLATTEILSLWYSEGQLDDEITS